MFRNHRIPLVLLFTFGLLVSVLSIGFCSEPEKRPTQFELYSWKKGNDWEYSLVTGKNNWKAAVEIKRTDGSLRGSSKIKEKVLDLQEGAKISWQERADSGLVYPPEVVIEDLKDYAQTVGVKVQVPRLGSRHRIPS